MALRKPRTAEVFQSGAADESIRLERDCAVLVDVREAGEWQDGHLKDAKHLALSDLRAGVPAEKLKKTITPGSVVYLHCASGKRCLAAADILKKQGYDVRPLKAGYEALLSNGFPQDR
jgi:phage shock protein E